MSNHILQAECNTSVFGVPARAFNVIADPTTGRIWNQRISASRGLPNGPEGYYIRVNLRFDDEFNNGHASFSITGVITDLRGREVCGGCIHDEIASAFPELAKLIPWHLTSTDGPMHYIANTVYAAGDRDHWGLRLGETRQIISGKTKLPCWILETDSPDLPRYVEDSVERPTETVVRRYVPWNRVGEGKPRELDLARKVAVWPDATDDELCAEPDILTAMLQDRLPKLLARFRADMEAVGFIWPL